MLNIIIYFPGPDSFFDRNLLGEMGSPVDAPVRSSVKVGGSPPGPRSLGRAGSLRGRSEGLSSSSLPPRGLSGSRFHFEDPLV